MKRYVGARAAACVVSLAVALIAGSVVPQAGAAEKPGSSTSVSASSVSADTLTVSQPDATGGVIVGVPSSFDRSDEAAAPFEVDVKQGSKTVRVAATRRTSGLALALVLDTSGSMRGEPLAAAKKAALQFIDALPADAQVSVSSFGATVKAGTPFGTDKAVARRTVLGLRAKGETAMRDAVVAAIDSLRPVTGRKAIVVLSDGADTASKTDRVATLTQVARAGIGVHPIILRSQGAAADAGGEDPAAELIAIAGATRGIAVNTPSAAELGSAFAQVAGIVGSPLTFTLPASVDPAVPFGVTVVRRFAAGSQQWTGSFGDVLVVSSEPAFVAPVETIPAAVAVAPAAAPAVVADPVQSGRGWLYLGTGSLLALVALGAWFVATMRPRRRLAAEFGVAHDPLLTSLSGAVENVAERLVKRHDSKGRLRNLLEGTGWSIDPGGFLAAVGLSTIAAALLLLGVAGLLWFMVALVVVPAIAYLVVRIAADRRRDLFESQFEGTLQLMSNSLRAGYGVNQAMDTVARESASPTSDEFLRALQEARLGQDQIVALRAMAQRVRSSDLDWVIDAIEVNREVGGSLMELFASVADTVRARARLARQVKALSAEGRLSAVVLVLLPFVMMGLLALINPNYIGALTGSDSGRVILLVAAGFMGIGVLWLKKIVKVTL